MKDLVQHAKFTVVVLILKQMEKRWTQMEKKWMGERRSQLLHYLPMSTFYGWYRSNSNYCNEDILALNYCKEDILALKGLCHETNNFLSAQFSEKKSFVFNVQPETRA
jgi:hypothetical protein